MKFKDFDKQFNKLLSQGKTAELIDLFEKSPMSESVLIKALCGIDNYISELRKLLPEEGEQKSTNAKIDIIVTSMAYFVNQESHRQKIRNKSKG